VDSVESGEFEGEKTSTRNTNTGHLTHNRRNRGDYRGIYTETETNSCFSILHKSFVGFLGTEFILISIIFYH
jgi:hypothetical protein